MDIKSWIDGRATAEEMHKEITAQEELATLNPAFAAYVYPQIQVSLMSEQLTGLKEMAPFADIISKAEDLYMPEGPPMSPLTRSYFSCWALFDACASPANETIGTTILEIGTSFGMHTELLRLIRQMQESRMGFYIHCGRKGNRTVLEDVVTDEIQRLRVGCQERTGTPRRPRHNAAICNLDVPVNKTSHAFTKPVDQIVGESIRTWEVQRPDQPAVVDEKTGEAVNVLFAYRGKRPSKDYINHTLVPILCRKAGVPPEDARGRITSHRARCFPNRNPAS